MPVPDVLRNLLTAPGPSGYEQAAAAVFRDAAASFAEVTNDSVGSSVARVKGTAGGPQRGRGELLALPGGRGIERRSEQRPHAPHPGTRRTPCAP